MELINNVNFKFNITRLNTVTVFMNVEYFQLEVGKLIKYITFRVKILQEFFIWAPKVIYMLSLKLVISIVPEKLRFKIFLFFLIPLKVFEIQNIEFKFFWNFECFQVGVPLVLNKLSIVPIPASVFLINRCTE